MLRSYGDAGRGFLKGAAFDCGSNHHSALSVGFFGHLSCRDKKGAVVVQFDKLKFEHWGYALALLFPKVSGPY